MTPLKLLDGGNPQRVAGLDLMSMIAESAAAQNLNASKHVFRLFVIHRASCARPVAHISTAFQITADDVPNIGRPVAHTSTAFQSPRTTLQNIGRPVIQTGTGFQTTLQNIGRPVIQTGTAFQTMLQNIGRPVIQTGTAFQTTLQNIGRPVAHPVKARTPRSAPLNHLLLNIFAKLSCHRSSQCLLPGSFPLANGFRQAFSARHLLVVRTPKITDTW
ncbi:hypothetical protein M407DRAFT_9819 [Tulasnella calospora MUT 4182]|uniref:Uncharacterized protein n=1 Tax=Tulasnella calospora MUT 4182 TaxID=1051891 RepID=A0A0C3LMW8_9AGAM|nr:hypothetical protein M407DRAFT_9819 [Tulasnella calospora MUT 4182]